MTNTQIEKFLRRIGSCTQQYNWKETKKDIEFTPKHGKKGLAFSVTKDFSNIVVNCRRN